MLINIVVCDLHYFICYFFTVYLLDLLEVMRNLFYKM